MDVARVRWQGHVPGVTLGTDNTLLPDETDEGVEEDQEWVSDR